MPAQVADVGALLASEFLAGTAAAGAEQHVVYDRAAGSLWLDADGSGDGVAVLLATLSNKIALGASDFLVI